MASEGNQEIATNITINGGIISAVQGDMHIHSSDSRRYGLELLMANITQCAFYDAAERGVPPRCHPGTRSAILEEIMKWIRAPQAHRKFILWLHGPVGAGKTAIAQTIAEECEKASLLAASFFFSRTAAGRNNASRFVATLAYQLSLSIQEIREPILTTIEKDPIIFSRTLSVQMQKLVVIPLASFTGPIRRGPQVVVVDGIDEVGPNGEAQAELLKVLGAAIFELRHIPIIFLIDSRPEYEIRLAFNTNILSSLMKGLVLDDHYKPDADIKRYFEYHFWKIREKQLPLGTRLPYPWPTKRDIDLLVKKSSGQFIFASTVITFIDCRRHPAERLDIILGLSDPGDETPFAQLDELYHYILSSVDDLPKVLEVLTLLMLANSYSNELRVGVVEEFLGFEVRRVLVDMHALVFVPSPTDPEAVLDIHHASLYDFLTDRSRSQNFYIDATQGHITIGQRWLRMIADHSHSKHYEQCRPSLQIKAVLCHCQKLSGGELADSLESFDLKALLVKIIRRNDLYAPVWDGFVTACKEQQPKTRIDIFSRLRNEFDDFIIDRLSQYPPSIQACIPALFIIAPTSISPYRTIPNIFLILLHGACRSEAEFAQIVELDRRLLNIRNSQLYRYFYSFFRIGMKSERYDMCQSSYVALAKEIVRVIRPKPDEAKLHVAVEDIETLLPGFHNNCHNSITKVTPLPLFDFTHLLSVTFANSHLGHFLRERTLQYKYSEQHNQCRMSLALSCLNYVQNCRIPYLRHNHPTNTDRCIICEKCPNASVCEDTDGIPTTSGVAVPLVGDGVYLKRGRDQDEGLDPSVTSIPEASIEAKSRPRKHQKTDEVFNIRVAPTYYVPHCPG